MIDMSGWGILVSVIVAWVGLLGLILVFMAAAAEARRREGLRVVRVLSDEHSAPGVRLGAPCDEQYGMAHDEWHLPTGSHRG